eukprot:GHVH01001221.1.p1 GENE.GHVH01001221.1~~GHVH01001221.1.p1  ORF type:complete len:437 (-),score=36.15 GHVH01001221.1:68-1378(-)
MLTVAYNSLQVLMYGDGHLVWICTENGQPVDQFGGCEAQNIAFSVLFSIISVADLCTTFLAGQVFDLCGPAATALMGQVAFHAGWIAFLNGNQQSFWRYTVGIFLMGFATNFNAMPIYTLGDYFPRQRTFLIHYTGVTETASAMILALMRILMNYLKKDGLHDALTFKTMMYYYMTFLSAPVGILFVLSLPRKRVNVICDGDDKVVPVAHIDNEHTIRPDLLTERVSMFGRLRRSQAFNIYTSVPFLAFCGYYAIHNLTWNYYDANSIRILGAHVACNTEALRVFASIVISLIWGLISTKIAVPWTNLVIVLLSALSMTIPVIRGYGNDDWWSVASYILFFVGYPQFWASKHVYCSSYFPNAYFGRTSGWITLGAGVMNIPLIAINSDGRLGVWMPVLLGSHILCLMFVTIILFQDNRRRKTILKVQIHDRDRARA